MRFDFLSFLIGFVTASIIGGILYRLRRQLSAVRQSAQEQATTTRAFISNSSEGRYFGEMVKRLNGYHAAQEFVPLTDVYIEPQFVRALEPVNMDAEKKNIFEVIPVIHELPASYAPYNIETLTMNDLQAGEKNIALLGLPGSGKSTALAILGLVASNEIAMETIDLESDSVFEDELKNLPPDQQEQRRKQRKETQQRALEHLKQSQKRSEEAGKGQSHMEFNRLLPILVHLRDIDLRPETYGLQSVAEPTATSPTDEKANGKKAPKPQKSSKPATKVLDPAEPLVKTLQGYFGTVTASTLPRTVYDRLVQGTCMVLIDGFEDITPEERTEKLTWLKEFVTLYKENFIIVTGPITGYDVLVNVGLTPLYLRAWSEQDFERMVKKWALAWPQAAATGRQRAAAPEEAVIRRVLTNVRGRLPLDVVFKMWAAFTNDEKQPGRRGWYDSYVRRFLEPAEARPLVEKMAAEILNGRGKLLSRNRIKEIVTAVNLGPDGKPTINVDDFVNKLTKRSGIMLEWPGGMFGFSHTLVTAFLASESLANADAAAVTTAANNPAWEDAMPFVAMHAPVDEAVNQRLSSMPDLNYSNVFSMVSWLPDSSSTGAWRGELFKRLTAGLAGPNQFPGVRERAMAALVASHDKNVFHVLRQGLKSPDPTVRRLVCVGLGALGETDAIKELGPLLQDPTPSVQLAAGMALGAIGTEAALETMLNGFLAGEQELRQAVAEALAAVPGEGHAVLRDAITSNDVQVRRASVFGLARIRAAWALSLLYRALLEDEQWYVRNAAEQAFLAAEGFEAEGATRHPEADSLQWLISWAAAKGEGVPAGLNARQVLIRVLQEGEPPYRAAAARTLGKLGHVPALKPLYNALRDKDESVRAAAYDALNTLQARLGEPLPAAM